MMVWWLIFAEGDRVCAVQRLAAQHALHGACNSMMQCTDLRQSYAPASPFTQSLSSSVAETRMSVSSAAVQWNCCCAAQ